MTRRQALAEARENRFADAARERAVQRLIILHPHAYRTLLREAESEVRNESAQAAKTA